MFRIEIEQRDISKDYRKPFRAYVAVIRDGDYRVVAETTPCLTRREARCEAKEMIAAWKSR